MLLCFPSLISHLPFDYLNLDFTKKLNKLRVDGSGVSRVFCLIKIRCFDVDFFDNSILCASIYTG